MRRCNSHLRRWAAIVGIGTMTFGIITSGATTAAGEVVAGNPSCSDLGYELGVKVENPRGSFTLDAHGLVMTMTVGTYPDVADPNPNNAVTSYAVDGASRVTTGTIVVKGGPAANVYPIGAAPPLHSPTLGNGKWPTISHVQVCFDRPEEPKLGGLEVTKEVHGDDAPTDATFEICVERPGGERTCEELAHGDTLVLTELPPGDYTITETDPGPGWTVEGVGNVVVVAGHTTTATVRNIWTAPPDEDGVLRLTKRVRGDGAPADATFTICVEPLDGTPGERVCTGPIGDGEVAEFVLPPGEYRAVEPELGDSWTMTVEPSTVVVPPAGEVDVEMTNTFESPPTEPGSVVLTKVIIGDPPDATYELCLVGPRPATDAHCRTIDGAGEVRLDDLAPGTYAVSETDPGAEYTVTIEPELLVVVGGAVADATVTNEFVRRRSLPPAAPVTTPDTTPATPDTTPATTPVTTPATTPATTPGSSPQPVTTPAPTPASRSPLPRTLPETGVDGRLVGIASLVLGAGLTLAAASRRPRRLD